ncbi:MAG: endonuclease III [Candidatus Levybacteria bacterium]|nr:endonuclease III [Candidatus Levybacteria bacterium]
MTREVLYNTNVTKEEKVKEIIKRLRKVYPHPKTALNFSTPLDLLVATIMSAQTTDKLVNTLTPALFAKYKTAKDYADAPVEDITKLISKVNFANNKAKNIKAAAQIIVEKHEGKVPDNMEELDALPGVARKTANVVLGNAYHKAEGIVVDTHVMRLSQKLGLTDKKDPEKIEQDLMQIVPKEDWIDFAHMLILFGREYCPARPHKCDDCPLSDLCPDQKV